MIEKLYYYRLEHIKTQQLLGVSGQPQITTRIYCQSAPLTYGNTLLIQKL